MSSLAEALVDTGGITLAVASVLPGLPAGQYTVNGVKHYLVHANNADEILRSPSCKTFAQCESIIDDFKPDIIHVHGTEHFYGLLGSENRVKVPIVISIQGLIHDYSKYYFSGLSLPELWRAHSLYELLRSTGLVHQRNYWRHQAAMERRIITGNRYFIGRTLWDRAHIRALNANARYFHCDELVRPAFYDARRDSSAIDRHTMFVPTGCYPIKGLHVALRAASILKKDFPDLLVRVPDTPFFKKQHWVKRLYCESGYSRYLRQLIADLGLEACVQPLGILNGEEMADQLARAHVMVLPSFIENSPNSLVEAMLVGTPTVVSFVGGIPSMVTDGISSLCYPSGDDAVLAECVREIFNNDDLAARITRAASDVAIERNSKVKITKKMLEIYREVYESQVDV